MNAAFNEFIGERERVNPKAKDPTIVLFDEVILSKRNRGRSSLFSGRMATDFLSNTADHLWRSAAATSFPPTTRAQQNMADDYSELIKRGWFVLFIAYD